MRAAMTVRLLVLCCLLGGLPGGPTQVGADERAGGSGGARVCFSETGFCVEGRFLEYWQAEPAGLALFGYPLSPEMPEKLRDHQVHTVQYFERVRLELHPENTPPYDVLIGHLGRYHHLPDPPVAPQDSATYFPATGHNVGGAFLAYWQGEESEHDGLATLGYPLSEELRLPTGTGATLIVQWFERARLERAEDAPPRAEAVQSSRLGAWVVTAREDRGDPGVTPRPGLFAPDEPAFTAGDVTRFLEKWWDTHPGPPCPRGPGTPVHSCPAPPLPPRGTIAAVDFLTSAALEQRLTSWQSFADEQLLALVTLHIPGRDRPTYVVFDAHSGKVRATLG